MNQYISKKGSDLHHECLACLVNIHQDIMQECSPHGIHVYELSDISHTFLRDLPCQRGCPTTLLGLHLLRRVRLKHYCSKHITGTHTGRNYKRDGINLWDLQRPLSFNKKYSSFAFFSFFFLFSMSQGVSHTREILKTSWVIIFIIWDHFQESTTCVMHVKFSLPMKGLEAHRHFIYHPKANSAKVQSFTPWLQLQCSFFLSFFLPPQSR